MSLLLVNTDKAKVLFESIKDSIDFIKVDVNDYIQPRMRSPLEKGVQYDNFWSTYTNKGFTAVLDRWGKNAFHYKVKRFIKKCLGMQRM